MRNDNFKNNIMKNTKEITAQSLKEVKYGDLLAKFTELGIPEVWKPGSKKAKMIATAVEKLAIVRSLEDRGLNQEEVQEELVKVEIKQQEVKQQKEVEVAQAQEAKEQAVVEKVEKSKLTQDQIKYNLRSIEQCLMANVPAQRTILLLKKEALLALLDD